VDARRSHDGRRFSSKAASVPAAYLLDLIGMRLIDRVARAAVRVGLGRRSTALIETTGRRSGKSRVTPVTNGLDGDVFWIVTEHGHKANYVRNIEANPRVRVNPVEAGGQARLESWTMIRRPGLRRSSRLTREHV
jgi:hypothetical protein